VFAVLADPTAELVVLAALSMAGEEHQPEAAASAR
jgi:hypothetical protein